VLCGHQEQASIHLCVVWPPGAGKHTLMCCVATRSRQAYTYVLCGHQEQASKHTLMPTAQAIRCAEGEVQLGQQPSCQSSLLPQLHSIGACADPADRLQLCNPCMVLFASFNKHHLQ
jgi:hypothetical protein